MSVGANANEGFLARVAQTTGVPKIPKRSSIDEEIRAREAEHAELEALTSQLAQLDASGAPGDTTAMAATAKVREARRG